MIVRDHEHLLDLLNLIEWDEVRSTTPWRWFDVETKGLFASVCHSNHVRCPHQILRTFNSKFVFFVFFLIKNVYCLAFCVGLQAVCGTIEGDCSLCDMHMVPSLIRLFVDFLLTNFAS